MRILDVRELTCAQRHDRVFGAFEALELGEGFEFVNDHEPRPLYHQFSRRYANQFSWDYLERGPVAWRMVIRRIAAGQALEFQPDPGLHIDCSHSETENQ